MRSPGFAAFNAGWMLLKKVPWVTFWTGTVPKVSVSPGR